MVGTIQEDDFGNLWLGTNAGLVQLNIPLDEKHFSKRVYTTADGLSDNYFIPHSFCRRGDEMFFGSYRGYNRFSPAQIEETAKETPFILTDIKIFNESISLLSEEIRNKISPLSPAFTKKLELPHY